MVWKRFLERVRAGAEVEDAAALEGILPGEIDSYLDRTPTRRRALAAAEAAFRVDMTRVLSDAAQVKQSISAAQALLKRKLPNRNQLRLDFERGPIAITLDMPDNTRENADTPTEGSTDPVRTEPC